MPFQAVKVYRDNEIRRCRLEIADDEAHFGYQRLLAKIRQLFPELENKNLRLMWKDTDNELIVIASIADFKEALANLPADDQVLRVYVFENETPKTMIVEEKEKSTDGSIADQPMEQDQPKQPNVEKEESKEQATESKDPNLHRYVVCDGCDGQIRGIRYKCLTCPDYDLCSTCMDKNGHDEHPTLRIVSPEDQSWKEAFFASQAFEFIPNNFCHGRRHCHQAGQDGCPRSGQQCQRRAEDEAEKKTEDESKQQDAAPILDDEIMRNLTGAIESVFNLFGVPVATSENSKPQEKATESKPTGSNEDKIQSALNFMLAMGYRDDDGQLKALLEKYRGEISSVMDYLGRL